MDIGAFELGHILSCNKSVRFLKTPNNLALLGQVTGCFALLLWGFGAVAQNAVGLKQRTIR
ncbi:MAG: hypothetical protein ACU0AU_04515, partial [Cognatishimia activa]